MHPPFQPDPIDPIGVRYPQTSVAPDAHLSSQQRQPEPASIAVADILAFCQHHADRTRTEARRLHTAALAMPGAAIGLTHSARIDRLYEGWLAWFSLLMLCSGCYAAEKQIDTLYTGLNNELRRLAHEARMASIQKVPA